MGRELLFDSNILIDLERGYRPVMRFFDTCRNDTWSISMITYGEFLQGTVWSTNKIDALRRFERIMGDFEILAISLGVMKRYAYVKGLLENQGQRIGTADLIIACTAMEYDQTLVTRNFKHFARIDELRLQNPLALNPE